MCELNAQKLIKKVKFHIFKCFWGVELSKEVLKATYKRVLQCKLINDGISSLFLINMYSYSLQKVLQIDYITEGILEER